MIDEFGNESRDLPPPRKRESSIEGPACKYARSKGWWVEKFKTPQRCGAPDRILMYGGYVFFIEFKAPNQPATEQQLEYHDELRKRGFNVYVNDSLDDAKRVIDAEAKELARRISEGSKRLR